MGQHKRRAPRQRLTVSVCIPTIPGREESFRRAVASVHAQTRKPEQILVGRDTQRLGAAVTRNRLLERVETDLVAWLDDDDWVRPVHIAALARAFEEDPTIDLAYPVPVLEPQGRRDTVAVTYQGQWPYSPWGLRWCPEFEQHIRTLGSFIPITHMVRTSVARAAGGFPDGETLPDGRYRGEDEAYLIALLDQGARFHHVDRRTWHWYDNPRRTEGRPAVMVL
jgi:glycosyltransferase involved in cell wall biosynthesis